MAKSTDVRKYPVEYFTLFQGVYDTQEPLTIECEDKGKAMWLRHDLYSFLKALSLSEDQETAYKFKQMMIRMTGNKLTITLRHTDETMKPILQALEELNKRQESPPKPIVPAQISADTRAPGTDEILKKLGWDYNTVSKKDVD